MAPGTGQMYWRTADIEVYPRTGTIPSVAGMRNQTTTPTSAAPYTSSHSAASSGTASTRPTGVTRRGSAGRRVLTVVGATVAALVVWLVADPVLGIDLTVQTAPGTTTTMPVTAGAVVLSSLLAGLLGWGLLALLERWGRRGVLAWRSVAGAVGLVSLGGPLSLAQSTGGMIVLTLLHVVVAAVLLVTLPRAMAGADR